MNQTPDTEQFSQVNIASIFGLHPDMTVEVLTMDNRLTFVGRWKWCAMGQWSSGRPRGTACRR